MTASLRNRIEVRAYYLSLAGDADAVANWLAAEKIELTLFAKRSKAAKQAAETRAIKKLDRAEAPLQQHRERQAARSINLH